MIPQWLKVFSSNRFISTKCSLNKSYSPDDLKYFQSFLRPESILTDNDSLNLYNKDWLNKYHGNSDLVLRPKSTEEISKILKYCNKRHLPIVPQGGNTGLVGGSVPVNKEIILSLSSMNKILNFDHVLGIVTVEAGCILENIDQFVRKKGYLMPLDLGSKGTCQIGGNIATNAGGLRLLRYGSLHGTVLGLEVVLADGTILDCLSTMRKDNTGYDIKQLFIGSEGTLGIITKVSLLTPPLPEHTNVAFLGCPSFENVKKTFIDARKRLGEILSALEFMDRKSLDIVFSQQSWSKDPLDSSFPYYILIETAGSNEKHDKEKLENFLEHVISKEFVTDGTVAQDKNQAKKLFSLREDITLALGSRGYVYKYDVSLPIDKYYDLVEETTERLLKLKDEKLIVTGYGHLGDCNLHLNISTKVYSENVFKALEPYVFERIAQYKGSISAEHGIGIHKPSYLHLSKSKESIQLMKNLKKLFDPNGILNPKKVLPS